MQYLIVTEEPHLELTKHVIFIVSCAAPSEVLAIRQENTSQNSVTLLWHEPDQPNGVILEYDIKYYEKVLD